MNKYSSNSLPVEEIDHDSDSNEDNMLSKQIEFHKSQVNMKQKSNKKHNHRSEFAEWRASFRRNKYV